MTGAFATAGSRSGFIEPAALSRFGGTWRNLWDNGRMKVAAVTWQTGECRRMDVQIEALQRHGRTLWQVRMGPRGLTFYEELAARAFAAQLHQRLLWLRELAAADKDQPTP